MRKLKFHESRLLRKTSFTTWDPKVSKLSTEYMQFLQSRFLITDLSVAQSYINLRANIKRVAIKIAKMKNTNTAKRVYIKNLIDNVKGLGVLKKDNLESCFILKVEDICKRRISQILVDKKMVENLRDATKFVEQGHVAIGIKVVSDPSILVSKEMERYVKWAPGSKIKKKVDEFNDGVDDYDNFY